MVHISRETPEQTHERLLEVIAAATFKVYDDAYVFEEAPLRGPIPPLDDRTLALVRDDRVWSRLVPTALDHGVEQFGLLRFHFPEGVDNSGFVGWLASHLKRELGTGVFVVCGQNSEQGGSSTIGDSPRSCAKPSYEKSRSCAGLGRWAPLRATERPSRRSVPGFSSRPRGPPRVAGPSRLPAGGSPERSVERQTHRWTGRHCRRSHDLPRLGSRIDSGRGFVGHSPLDPL